MKNLGFIAPVFTLLSILGSRNER